MKNRYFGLRHGESKANVAGLVVSEPTIGTESYGLSDRGREQVVASLEVCVEFDQATKIICSDFVRALETAVLASEVLGCDRPVTDSRLRERFFGKWDMQSNNDYETVWAMDAQDPNHCTGGVESASAVCDRLWSLIKSLEIQYLGDVVLLVSHGDPLQLLQTAFEKRSPSTHRKLEPWGTAEVRMFHSPASTP